MLLNKEQILNHQMQKRQIFSSLQNQCDPGVCDLIQPDLFISTFNDGGNHFKSSIWFYKIGCMSRYYNSLAGLE